MSRLPKGRVLYLLLLVFVLFGVIAVSGTRLPTVDGDSGTWGTVLNNYLQTEHSSTGSHINMTVSNESAVDYYFNMSDGITPRLIVDSEGDVGLGMFNPAAFLHIENTSRIVSNAYFNISDGLNQWLLVDPAGNLLIKQNVGIGTSTPAGLLNINGTGNTLLNVTNESADLFMVNETTAAFGEGINVGIGTTTPGNKFEISGTNVNIATGPHMRFTTSADAYPLFQMVNWGHDSITMYFDAYYDGAHKSSDAGSNFIIEKGGANADKLLIGYDSGVAAGSAITWNPGIVLDTSGNVGIGTTSPGATLEVVNTSAVTNILNVSHGDDMLVVNATGIDLDSNTLFVDSINNRVGIGTTSPGLDLVVERTAATGSGSGGRVGITSNNGSVLVAGDRFGIVVFGGYTGDAIAYGAGISSFASEEWVSGSSPGELVFETAPNATTTRSERMRITSTGSVGIGTTSPGAKLEVINDSAYEGLLLNITNGATDFVYNATTGNVGIGTTSPGAKLHVSGGNLLVDNTYGLLCKRVGDGAETPIIQLDNDDNIVIGHGNLDEIRFNVDNVNNAMTIDGSGSVGIGTTAPGATLEVVNQSAVSALFNVTDGSDTRFVVDGAGNVGIGTTNPGYKLDVAGETQAQRYRSDTTNVETVSGTYTLGSSGGKYVYGFSEARGWGYNSADDAIYYQAYNSIPVVFKATGEVGIGTTSISNSTMKLEIYGGDLNVSGMIFYKALGSQSPMIIKSVDEKPIPVCMKNSIGNWVGCMPDENNAWACKPNRECDEHILSFETERQLKAEGLNENEVGEKLGFISKKFEQGKDLETIKSEVRAEIGEITVLNELDDTQSSFSIQSSSSEVNALVGEFNSLKSENDALKELVCLDHPGAEVCKKGVASEQSQEPVQENLTEQTPPEQQAEAPAANNAPVIKSFTPEAVPVMSIGDSQEFTVTVSDADENDVLTTQWYVNNLPIADQVLDSFTFTATEIGEFDVKVLVADGKDYVTKEWTLTAGQQGKSYGITGAAVSIVNKGSGSLLSWLKSLF